MEEKPNSVFLINYSMSGYKIPSVSLVGETVLTASGRSSKFSITIEVEIIPVKF